MRKLFYFFTLTLLAYCCVTKVVNKKTNQNLIQSNIHFSKNQHSVLTEILNNFNTILEKKYDNRMYLYLLKLKGNYDTDTLKEEIERDWSCCEFVKKLRESKLLREMYKKENQKFVPILKVKKWVDSIRNSKLEFNEPSFSNIEEKDLKDINLFTNFNIQENNKLRIFNNYLGKFYYILYKSLSYRDKNIKKIIIEIVKLDGVSPLFYVNYAISTFDEKELNNSTLKLIIFNEIILPNLLNPDICC
ncbi:hypothetical protein JL193_09490 [Polaribacter batillariae]|uniref:Lipoprotein n=1 Tax=Polaribacter batillariae TaxID=2808900 RepID=A0ABX7SQA0_9FLAO|nr:hypothetical protein [Polaribacter batillariae]QTD36392.1 hypothetical protein JL193_09490 [Polaribacter batillariae]